MLFVLLPFFQRLSVTPIDIFAFTLDVMVTWYKTFVFKQFLFSGWSSCILQLQIYLFINLQGAYDKFPDFFCMGI